MTHCHCDRVCPCLCAKFSAKAPNPVAFTASTTVCQVRGRVPVPVWLEVHLPKQVQHAVIWFAKFTCCNALHGLVVHTQEGTKVPPFCIQLVVESFNDVCRQRRGGKDMVLLCCEATAVLPQTHWQCQVVEVVEEGGGWKHQGRAPQRVGRWWHPGRRERKNSKTACFHSHSIYIRYSKNGVQTAECGGQTLNA